MCRPVVETAEPEDKAILPRRLAAPARSEITNGDTCAPPLIDNGKEAGASRIQSSLRDEDMPATPAPALKGRATFNPPLTRRRRRSRGRISGVVRRGSGESRGNYL